MPAAFRGYEAAATEKVHAVVCELTASASTREVRPSTREGYEVLMEGASEAR